MTAALLRSMTTTTEVAPRWRLVRVYDVRPIDFYTGKRVPVSAMDELPECNRCGRAHAKVYVVQDRENPARVSTVGSGCCKRAFDGWEPTAQELKSARAAERAREAEAREGRVTELARPIVAAMAAVVVPAPRLLETIVERWGTREVWGTESHRVFCFEGFNAERRRCYESSVREPVRREMLEGVPGTLRTEVYQMVDKLRAAGR